MLENNLYKRIFFDAEVPKLWAAPPGGLLVLWGGTSLYEGHLF
jgi:hypothetical protein